MGNFRKFNSIINTTQQEYLDKVLVEGHGAEIFVVLEKYHGANFGVVITPDTIEYQKRTTTLKENEEFYSFQGVVNPLKDKLRESFSSLRSKFPSLTKAIFYGELLGGIYSGVESTKKDGDYVFMDVQYHPDQKLVLFDTYYYTDIREAYLDHNTVMEITSRHELDHAEILFSGTFEECLEFSRNHNADLSVAHKKWGLPEVPENIREGNVIKPLKDLRFKNGSRIIFKDKNEKFRESKLTVKSITKFSDEASGSKELIKAFVTENRLKNVLSKGPRFTGKEFGKLMGLFMKDLVADFRDHHGELFDSLSKKERKSVTNYGTELTKRLIMTHFAKIIEGTY